jgi:hypothetical protein
MPKVSRGKLLLIAANSWGYGAGYGWALGHGDGKGEGTGSIHVRLLTQGYEELDAQSK